MDFSVKANDFSENDVNVAILSQFSGSMLSGKWARESEIIIITISYISTQMKISIRFMFISIMTHTKKHCANKLEICSEQICTITLCLYYYIIINCQIPLVGISKNIKKNSHPKVVYCFVEKPRANAGFTLGGFPGKISGTHFRTTQNKV